MRVASFTIIALSLCLLCLLDFINLFNVSRLLPSSVLSFLWLSPTVVFSISFALCLLTTLFAAYRILYVVFKRRKGKKNK